MIRTFEATIDEKGRIQLLLPVQLPPGYRVLVTILDEPATEPNEISLLSESALADWSRIEEDEAWAHLQPEK